VSLQLAGLGKCLVTRVTLEHSGLLGAERRARLVRQHVLLEENTETKSTLDPTEPQGFETKGNKSQKSKSELGASGSLL
jgi:hypothetical protein